MTTAVRTKALALHSKASGSPDAAQLAAIRAYTLRDFTADELVVREFALAHNAIDRDNEVMDEPLLADFARTLPGKGSYIKHPTGWQSDGGPAEGRIFDARVERMSFDAARIALREPNLIFPPDRSEAHLLYCSVFYAKTPENLSLLTKLDAGIVGDCSIGFQAADMVPIKDAAGNELRALRWVAPGEAYEMSLVWLGAQPGARAVKGAFHQPEIAAMTPEEIAAMKAENARMKALIDAAGTQTAVVAGIKTALGKDHEALADTPAQLGALVVAGVAYRKSLVDDIVTSERHLKITGDDADAVKAATDLYTDLPTAKLEAMHKALGKQLVGKGGSRITGADPNGQHPGDAADATKAPGPFSSVLMA